MNPFLLSSLSGFLYSLSFYPIGFWWAAPIAFAIFFKSLQSQRSPELSALIFGFSSALLILSWSKTFVGVLPWLLLVLLQALFLLPLGVTARFTRSLPLYIFTYCLLEELKSRFPFGGFSWVRVAFSQVDSPLVGVVSYLGVIGLTLVTLWVSAAILNPAPLKSALLFLILIFTSFAMPTEGDDSTMRVRAIQGGVPSRGLDFNSRAMQVLDNHINVTRKEISGGEDVIVWPENSVDVDPVKNIVAKRKIQTLIDAVNVDLIAGAIIEPDDLYNATIHFDHTGNIRSTYIKRYLTPFGEYIPLRPIAEFISPYAQFVTDFTPGRTLITHSIKGTELASVICYEILNDGLIREGARASSLLIVHTNSATFSGSSEGRQQLAITRIRAIEMNRSVVSISTTGPSALINPRGVVESTLNDGEVGSLVGDMKLNDSLTFSSRFGGLITLFVLLLSLALALTGLRRVKL